MKHIAALGLRAALGAAGLFNPFTPTELLLTALAAECQPSGELPGIATGRDQAAVNYISCSTLLQSMK